MGCTLHITEKKHTNSCRYEKKMFKVNLEDHENDISMEKIVISLKCFFLTILFLRSTDSNPLKGRQKVNILQVILHPHLANG